MRAEFFAQPIVGPHHRRLAAQPHGRVAESPYRRFPLNAALRLESGMETALASRILSSIAR